MQSTEITFDNLNETGGLFTALLRERYHHFISVRGWPLPNVRGLEFDQYDTPETVYCAIHDGNSVQGGFRMTPTTAQCMNTTYMLRDAQRGLLQDLPRNVLDSEAPQDPRIWEVSRVFVSDTLSSRERMQVRTAMGQSFAGLALKWDIDAFLCLTSVSSALLTRRSGLELTAAGPRFENTGEICQAYHLKVRTSSPEMRATQRPMGARDVG